MAIVSEGLGLKEANTVSTFMQQMAILIAEIIKDSKEKGKKYVDEHMKGAKAILKHIKKGGKTVCQAVDQEDAALFEKILKHKRVPYVRLADENGKTTFVTRDSDAKLVEQAWEMFADELKVGFKEQTPHEFINSHAEQNICQANGFTEVELEVFRKEAAKLGFTYAVVGNEKDKGKHDILYAERDRDIVAKAIKGMEYELNAGPEGAKYRKEMQDSLNVKNSILKESKENKGQMIYIVNHNNPLQFITISDGKMIEHNLSIEEKKGRDGQIQKVVKDKSRKTFPFGNRELTNAMKSYDKCSQVSKESMNFVKGFDSAGNAIVTDASELGKALSSLEKDFRAEKYPTYEIHLGRRGQQSFDKIRTLSDVEMDKMVTLTQELDKAGINHVAVNDSIVYREQDKARVKEILNRTLYKDMRFTERFESKVFYEGRGPEGFNMKDLKEPVYIISAKDPHYMIKLDDKGFSVLQDGQVVTGLEREDPSFETNLESLVNAMEDDIAVITETEAKKSPEERVQTIENRAAVKENEASTQYSKAYDEQKEQFLNTNFESMDEKDKEIYKKYTEHEVKVTYIDRTLAEKIIDRDFGTKMKEEHTTTTRTTKTRDTDPER